MLTPAGLAIADEDDPLPARLANLAGVLIRYARVSTSGQNLDRQARALTEGGCIRIFAGKQPGKTAGPSRARRVPGLPPRRRHPRCPAPGPAVPVPAGPDHHRGRAAPPRHRVPVLHEVLDTTTPGRPAGLPRLRGPGRVHPGLIVEGFALPGAATGQHGQAAALLAWLAAHRTPRPAQLSAASAGCAVPRRPRSHTPSDARFPGRYGGRPAHCLICCWMTSGAGRASTV